jgi:hypothetical protein
MTMTNQISNFFAGIQYACTGNADRAEVKPYHRAPKPLKLNKGTFADVSGLKPIVRQRTILTEQGEEVSRFTIGFEVEKNSFHRNAVQEYILFAGFERDISCGLEAITNILPLLPAGKWRNKVFDLFVQAEKILDSRYSPADRRCGGHVTITAKGLTSDELRQAIRPFAGILLALFEKRIMNSYCNSNLRMQDRYTRHWNGVGAQGGRYQVCLEKGFADGTEGLEFRIVNRFDSVKQTMRRYELFYALVDTAVNAPNTSHETFLKRIRPIVLSMYGGDVEATELRLKKARHYRRFIMEGKLSKLIAVAVDPRQEHLEAWDAEALNTRTGVWSPRA